MQRLRQMKDRFCTCPLRSSSLRYIVPHSRESERIGQASKTRAVSLIHLYTERAAFFLSVTTDLKSQETELFISRFQYLYVSRS